MSPAAVQWGVLSTAAIAVLAAVDASARGGVPARLRPAASADVTSA